MKKTDRLDAFLDIIILAVFIFTVMIIIADPIIRYVLIIAGCGAMFNNFKYAFKKVKKKKSAKKKEKNN